MTDNQQREYHTGDILTARVRSLPFIFHQGIIVNEGSGILVYHNTPRFSNEKGGNVVTENIDDWLKTREVVNVEPTNMTADYIRSTSEERANMKFDLLSFNCEHYVSLLKTGKLRSPQLLKWSLGLILICTIYRLS